VGRTGRMGRSGRAITLIGPGDLPKWHEIERGIGKKLPRIGSDGQEIKVVASTNGSKTGAGIGGGNRGFGARRRRAGAGAWR
ncbi:MAG TPA: RNA helicase, partial [Dehalococcoidia bacterium]